MTNLIKQYVLDYGFVELITDEPSDLTVVNAARISFAKRSHWQCGCGGIPIDEPCCNSPGNYRLQTIDTKIIDFLARNNHWTPLAHPRFLYGFDTWPSVRTLQLLQDTGSRWRIADNGHFQLATSLITAVRLNLTTPSNCDVTATSIVRHYKLIPFNYALSRIPWDHWPEQTPLTFHIKLPIFVARQLMRSSVGIVYNEISRRYLDGEALPIEFYEPLEWRSRPPKNIKQGSGLLLSPKTQGHATLNLRCAHTEAKNANHYLTKQDVAPEMARIPLPVSMYTEIYMTAALSDFARVARLRLDPHAQLEVRRYAIAIDQIISNFTPHVKLWKELLNPERTQNVSNHPEREPRSSDR